MPDLTLNWAGFVALALFVVAYAVAMLEEQLHLRKSVPVLIAGGLIWLVIAVAMQQAGHPEAVGEAVRHNILEFAEIFLFLIVAMTYVNTMGERHVFAALRAWLVARGFSLRALFWVTGGLAFVMSPVADNLTTALVLGTVVVSVGDGRPRFVTLALVNVVVAANAGGVFSPFGDITTLMVWQAGKVNFAGFLPLFLPAVVNWLVPAVILSSRVGNERPEASAERVSVDLGAYVVVGLFLATITLTVLGYGLLQVPPAVGMLLGLGLLKLYGYVHNRWRVGRRLVVDELDDVFMESALEDPATRAEPGASAAAAPRKAARPRRPLDTFSQLERVEWDTLLFFCGVILAVGGLGKLGYLALLSIGLYTGLGATLAHTVIGVISAIIDNVPVMFAVLTMAPDLSQGQWLLVTLTAGVGGSLLSIGSAAGVALMGQARGVYTFMAHLKWTWAIALGYVASIGVHLLLNRGLF